MASFLSLKHQREELTRRLSAGDPTVVNELARVETAIEQHADCEVEPLMHITDLTDQDLDAQIGAATLDGERERLEHLEQERARRRQAAERHRLADDERQRRMRAEHEAERQALLDRLIALRADLRGRFLATLDALDRTVPVDAGPLIVRAYELGRGAYSLSHDLASVTGDRQRFETRYDVPDHLALHGGPAGEAFVAGVRGGRPPVIPTPWRDDVERLRDLWPPRQDMRSLT